MFIFLPQREVVSVVCAVHAEVFRGNCTDVCNLLGNHKNNKVNWMDRYVIRKI